VTAVAAEQVYWGACKHHRTPSQHRRRYCRHRLFPRQQPLDQLAAETEATKADEAGNLVGTMVGTMEAGKMGFVATT